MATQPFHCLPSHTISNVLSRHEAIVSGCVYTSGISSLSSQIVYHKVLMESCAVMALTSCIVRRVA